MRPNTGCKSKYLMVDGKKHERIKSEELCHDCNAGAGKYHHFNCDAERCPVCHGQLIGCDCDVEYI